MSSPDGSVTQWLKQLGGEEGSLAQEALFQRYFEKLVRLARVRLERTPRCAEDEEDVALSALDSFFRCAQDGGFERLFDRDDLWTLLVTFVSRKAISQMRRQTALKRGGQGGSKVGLDEAAISRDEWENMISSEPTPEIIVQLQEEYDRRLDSLGCSMLREIAELSLQGYTQHEIASRLQTSERTIRRKLYRVRREWLEAST